jgi:hypothetical protein
MEKQTTKQIPFKFDSRYVFSDTVARILRLVENEKIIENLVMSTTLPYVFTKEPIPFVFNYSLSEAMVKESYSKITYEITHKNILSPILLSFNLTENTIEKTVLVIFEIEIVKRDLIPEEYYDKINKNFPVVCIEMIKNMEKELEEDNKDIYHYESKIFYYSRDKIWYIITNMHNFMSKENIIKDCNISTPISKEGCELSFNICGKNQLCKIKVNKYKNQENDDKWTMGTIPLCGPFAHSQINWTLIKLGENETLMSNISKYNEHIDPDIKKQLSEEKKRTFDYIDKLLKDLYGDSKNNSNNKNQDNKDTKKK